VNRRRLTTASEGAALALLEGPLGGCFHPAELDREEARELVVVGELFRQSRPDHSLGLEAGRLDRGDDDLVNFDVGRVGAAGGGGQHLEFEVCSGIAQPVEQAAVNRKVQGSSPCPGAKFRIQQLGGRPAALDTDAAVLQQFAAIR
jgi:hypothetical protein